MKKYQKAGKTEVSKLNLENAGRRLWLVKVPKFLAPTWREAEEGAMLGTLELSNKDPKTSTYALELPDTEETKELPKKFEFKFIQSLVDDMYTFSSDPRTNCGSAIEGKIVKEAAVVPQINAEYLRINKLRTEQANKAEKSTKFVDRGALARAKGMGYAQLSTDMTFTSKYMKPKGTDMKKERMQQPTLIYLLLTHFAEYPYWTLKGLAERTQQPLAYLKEVLGAIAVLNKRGPYTGMYSISSEYAEFVEGINKKKEEEESSNGGSNQED